MKKILQKKLKNEKGMTLIELLAVIVIIAIIAAIAIPAIGNIIENSRVGAIKSDAQNILSASELYFVDFPDVATVDLATLTSNGYVEDVGSFKDATPADVDITKAVAATTGTSPTAAAPTKISGAAATGKVQVTFTGATRDNIEAVANSDENGTTEVAINRNYTP